MIKPFAIQQLTSQMEQEAKKLVITNQVGKADNKIVR